MKTNHFLTKQARASKSWYGEQDITSKKFKIAVMIHHLHYFLKIEENILKSIFVYLI